MPFLIIMASFAFQKRKNAFIYSFYVNNKAISISFIVYLAVSLLSLVYSSNPLPGLGKLIYYFVTGFFFCCIVYDNMGCEENVRLIVITFQLVAIVLALHGILLRLFAIDPLMMSSYTSIGINDQMNRVTSTLGNSIPYGTLLVMLIPFFSYDYPKGNTTFPFIARYIGIVLVSCAVLLSGSRGSYVGLLIIAIFFLRINFLKKKSMSSFVVKLLFMFAFIFGFITLSYDKQKYAVKDYLLSRIPTIEDVDGEAIGGRIDRYLFAREVIKDKPLLGLGFGNVQSNFDRYQINGRYPIGNWAKTTENQFLMVLCETGILGLLAYLFFLFFLGRKVLKKIFQNVGLADACLISFVALLVMMTSWDALNNPSIRIYFFGIIGVAMGLRRFSS